MSPLYVMLDTKSTGRDVGVDRKTFLESWVVKKGEWAVVPR